MIATTLIYDIQVNRITGEPATLAEFRGKVLLIVNVASQCGLTSQYDGLEKIYSRYRDRGFEVLGFPANDFAGQEPGSNQEIATFCQSTFGASFPMFEKMEVTGPNAHPLYRALTAAKPTAEIADPGFRAGLDSFLKSSGATTRPLPEILWNFEKFLVDREGNIIARFAPDMLPEDARITAAIEKALQA